jgi:tetratricopeptide (TPR) repeat protein
MDRLRFQRAIRERDSGKPLDAYHEFESMLQDAKDPAELGSLLLNMATCKGWMRDFEGAKALVQRARALFPPGERTPQMYADFVDASTFAASRQFAEAAVKFQALLNDYSDLLSTTEEEGLRIDARERLGLALVASRQFQEAIPILEELVRLGVGEQQRIHLYLGIAYSFLPVRTENAKAEFHRATTGPAADLTKEAFCRLGILEFQAGRSETARNLLERAVREGPSDSEWNRVAMDYLSRIQPNTSVV